MVIEIGVARAQVLGRYQRAVMEAEQYLEIQREKLAIAAEAALAGIEVPGTITVIDEIAGTITTEDPCDDVSTPSGSLSGLEPATPPKSSSSTSAGAGSNTGAPPRTPSTRSGTSFSTRSRRARSASAMGAGSVPRSREG